MAKPIASFRNRGIDVAIWEGKTSPTISIRKQYKDKITNEWKESKSFFPEELQELIKLLGMAIDELAKKPGDKVADHAFDPDETPF